MARGLRTRLRVDAGACAPPRDREHAPMRAHSANGRWLVGVALLALIAAMLVLFRSPRVTPEPVVASDPTQRSQTSAQQGDVASLPDTTLADTTVRETSTGRESAPPTLRVYGTVTRGGTALADRRVWLFDPRARDVLEILTDGRGAWAFAVSPGSYLVHVPFAETQNREPGSLIQHDHMAATRSAVVKTESVRLQFDLPSCVLTVRAVDAGTLVGIAFATISVGRSARRRSVTTDAGGFARFEDLKNGALTVSGFKRGFRSSSILVELDDKDASQTVLLGLEGVGAVDLHWVDERRQPIEVPLMPLKLVSVDDGKTSPVGVLIAPEHIRDGWIKPEQDRLTWTELSPGRHRLLIADESGDDIERYQPVGPISLDFDVPAGQVTSIDLAVQRRASVRLRGRSHDHTAPVTLTVERLDSQRGPRRVLPTKWQQEQGTDTAGFDGHLIPGVYTLRFEQGTRRHRESLVVGSENIERTYELPW